MADKTPRFNFDTNHTRFEDWDYDDEFDLLDELNIERDTIANRPASGEYDDELFYATDQNVLWGWDETNTEWIIRGGKGSSSQPIDSFHTEDVASDTGYIDDDESVIQRNPFREQGAAVADDGTYYAFERDSGDHILKKTTTPRDASSWETVHTFSNAGNTNFLRDLHITANGTLLVAVDGVIKRSTDGGSSWSNVYTLSHTDNAVWSFSENGNGDLIATEYPNNIQLLQSTDDGGSWSVLADGTNFGFGKHCHKARYHPADDTIIIVTGGDGGSGAGFYRSTDGGTSWDYFNPMSTQFVGIVGHPTDSTVYFLGADEGGARRQGVWKISDSGGTSLDDYQLVQNFNTSGGTSAAGPFQLYAVITDNGGSGILGSIVGASRNQDADQIFASTGLNGEDWRSLGEIPNGWTTGTTGAGSGENVIDTRVSPWDSSPWLVASDDVLSAKNVLRGDRGGQAKPPLDQSSLRRNPFVSTEPDFSDVTVHHQVKSPTAQTDYTLMDVTDGPKTVVEIIVEGMYAASAATGSSHRIGPVTVDGTQTTEYPSADVYQADDQSGDLHTTLSGFPFHYEDSCKIEWRHPGNGNNVMVAAYVLDAR